MLWVVKAGLLLRHMLQRGMTLQARQGELPSASTGAAPISAPISACLSLMVTHVNMSETAPVLPHPGFSSLIKYGTSVCRGLEKALDQMDGSWRGTSSAQQPSKPAGLQSGVQASSDGTAPAAAVQELEQQQAQAGSIAAAKVGGLNGFSQSMQALCPGRLAIL